MRSSSMVSSSGRDGRSHRQLSRQVQRSAAGTPASASSTCSPHPAQVGLPQLSHVTFLHIASFSSSHHSPVPPVSLSILRTSTVIAVSQQSVGEVSRRGRPSPPSLLPPRQVCASCRTMRRGAPCSSPERRAVRTRPRSSSHRFDMQPVGTSRALPLAPTDIDLYPQGYMAENIPHRVQ